MAAKNTFGIPFRVGTAGGSLTAVAMLTNIDFPAFSREAIEVTTHDSASGVAEHIPGGVLDVGPIKIEGYWVAGSTDDDRLIAAMVAGTLLDWEIDPKAASGNKTFSGADGFLTDYTPGPAPVKGAAQTFSATLQPSGPITVEA
jgi:predicted secreted protein